MSGATICNIQEYYLVSAFTYDLQKVFLIASQILQLHCKVWLLSWYVVCHMSVCRLWW